jgi:hypothetical protein
MNRHHVVRLNDPRLRWPRRLFLAASIALTLFTLTGFFVTRLYCGTLRRASSARARAAR